MPNLVHYKAKTEPTHALGFPASNAQALCWANPQEYPFWAGLLTHRCFDSHLAPTNAFGSLLGHDASINDLLEAYSIVDASESDSANLNRIFGVSWPTTTSTRLKNRLLPEVEHFSPEHDHVLPGQAYKCFKIYYYISYTEVEKPREPGMATEFLSTVYRLNRLNGDSEASRFCYNYFFDLRKRKDYKLCDRILADVDATRLSPMVLMSLLTTTAPLKTLRNRRGFYDRVHGLLERSRGIRHAENALAGLK